ncbi:polyserase-2-like isoform X2 [Armigeres subalbatus]
MKVDYLCGGTLITLNYVLTAAHCSADSNQEHPDTVRLGDVDLSSDQDEQNVQQVAIKRFLPHPDFKVSRSYHDIALIELVESINPGRFVCSACLWTDMSLGFEVLTVMGFGSTTFAAESSPILLKADLSPLGEAECRDQFPMNRKISEGILASQFCAAAPDKDACPGDSGGPILVDLVDPTPYKYQKKIPFVAGIISIGTGCNDGSMGLYTRVASYIDWIQNITGVDFDPTTCARNTECAPFHKETISSVVVKSPFSNEFHVDLMSDNSSQSICGGSLIDYRHVLTSADCVSGQNKPNFVLQKADRANITMITIHPKSSEQKNNLAIIELDKFFEPGARFQASGPACLMKNSNRTDNRMFVSVVESQFQTRMTANVLVTPSSQCKEGLICMENKENFVPKSCEIQLGGSVINYIISETGIIVPILHGINSKGRNCGGRDEQFEAVSIAEHYAWIESVVLDHIAKTMKNDETFNQQEYFEEDPCLPASGEGLGKCVTADRCQRLLENHRKGLAKVKTCLFKGHLAIVCCPNAYL